jgi:predicted DNA-binding protein YlxM (UPF0122 family)
VNKQFNPLIPSQNLVTKKQPYLVSRILIENLSANEIAKRIEHILNNMNKQGFDLISTFEKYDTVFAIYKQREIEDDDTPRAS